MEAGAELQVGDDLYVIMVDPKDLREQDINAQVMQPRHMERLTENMRIRGQVESLPYCHWQHREGPIWVVSGHHRVRAAIAAEITLIPALVDTAPMTRSTVRAKQVAHNELHGDPDPLILGEMVRQITSVDDLLMTGLPEEFLPTVGPDDTTLGLPHADFEWHAVTLLFLPRQMTEFKQVIDAIDPAAEVTGLADRAQFEEFATKVIEFGRTRNIRSVAAALAVLCRVAGEQIAADEADGIEIGSDWIRVAELVGPQLPPDAAKIVAQAVERLVARGDVPHDQLWKALEYWAADSLGGR